MAGGGGCLASAPSSPTGFINHGTVVSKNHSKLIPTSTPRYSSSKNSRGITRPLSVKASSKDSFSTTQKTLTSNWDVPSNYSAAAAAPSWMPRFEELDTTNMLLRQRIVFLGSQVDDVTADFVVSQLLFLDAEDQKKDIKLFINSPGGSITAGMGIYDAMKLCKADVSTICLGLAASMGAFLLATGTKGKRYIMPNARVMIHQPMGTAGGNAIEMGLRVRELVYHKIKLNKILSRVTGQTEKQVEIDTVRDNFMDPWEAKEYGLVDVVIDDGKPGLVAPLADASPPPKTKVWHLWKVEEDIKARKNLPSEEKFLEKGYIGGSESDEVEQEKKPATPV